MFLVGIDVAATVDAVVVVSTLEVFNAFVEFDVVWVILLLLVRDKLLGFFLGLGLKRGFCATNNTNKDKLRLF